MENRDNAIVIQALKDVRAWNDDFSEMSPNNPKVKLVNHFPWDKAEQWANRDETLPVGTCSTKYYRAISFGDKFEKPKFLIEITETGNRYLIIPRRA